MYSEILINFKQFWSSTLGFLSPLCDLFSEAGEILINFYELSSVILYHVLERNGEFLIKQKQKINKKENITEKKI